ncbi:MAG: acylphosphatase [Dongiaceae bacterium]
MAGKSESKAVRIRIRGRVQNVWFRAWTVEQASQRGLAGWVRNRMDGSVEALFSGAPHVVDEMIALCWQGPRAARVEAIDETLAEPPAEPGFVTLSTE